MAMGLSMWVCRAVLKNPNFLFFSLTTAIKDRQPPTATNRQPPPTANRHQPPAAKQCSVLFLWFCLLPIP